jgi:hypothetical protein
MRSRRAHRPAPPGARVAVWVVDTRSGWRARPLSQGQTLYRELITENPALTCILQQRRRRPACGEGVGDGVDGSNQ